MADNLMSLDSSFPSSETEGYIVEEHRESKRKRSLSSSEEFSSNDESISLPGKTIIVPNAWYSFLQSVNYKLKSVPKYVKVACKRATNLSPLPDMTSDWSETHSDIISIHQKFLVNLEPSDFISFSYIKGIIMPTHKIEYIKWKSKDLLVQQITRCMATALESINLDFEAIQDIPLEVPEKMKNDLRVWKKGFLKTMKLQKLEKDRVNVIKDYCRHVEQYGRKFADQLKYMMINKRDEIETSQFLQLFQFFLMMFNFNVSCLPNIDRQTLEIGDTKISSIPDFLVTEEKESLDVLIVGKVKQRYGKLNNKSSFVRSRCCQSHDSPVRHVSEDLIGQHGGELLSHIHLSLFGEKGIFGMIVQGTQVSLTSLFPESGYMENLKKGEGENKEAILNISKGYNILTRAGRESLLEPLLDLYFLQAYTYSLRGLEQEKTAIK